MVGRLLLPVLFTGPLLTPAQGAIEGDGGALYYVWAVAFAAVAVVLAEWARRAQRSPAGSHRRHPAWLAATVGLAAVAWLLPDAWFLPTSGSPDQTALVKAALGSAFGLAVAGALLWPRLLRPGAAAAVALLACWPLLRPTIVHHEVAAGVARTGHPPRDLFVAGTLHGSDPTGYQFTDGAVSLGFIPFDAAFDDGPVAYLSARRRTGAPCDVLLAAAGPHATCTDDGHGTWHVTAPDFGSGFARVEGTVLVTVDNDGGSLPDAQLLALLDSAHPASDAELVSHT
ncbi:hypothetical protein GCM10009738_25140 [Kitasatospora viridis]|uniref:Uncharacterized protein n=1 Tax=Kitasatospora viridis TaxID=281105 RepID=A0A561SDR4_9ACTN|nr:hypothetical protein FHX73_16148 [Kitasatospora viridis]